MPDTTSIPGVTSKYDTQKLIEELMKVERIPKDRAEARLKQLELQRSVWLDINRRFISLREKARNLFSFQNPFNDRIAKSSNEQALTATATRQASNETHLISIKQVATADRFMSDRLSKDYSVASGLYTFGIGDKIVELNFEGGTLNDFVTALNKKGGDLLRAQLVPITTDERILVIESLKTGSKSRLSFKSAAENLGLQTGLITKGNSSEQTLSVTNPRRLTSALDASKVLTNNGTLQIAPGGEAALTLPAPVQTQNLVLEIEIEFAEKPGQAQPGIPPGPNIPGTGSIEYQGLVVHSAPSGVVLPPQKQPAPPPPRVDSNQILYALDASGKQIALPSVPGGQGKQKVTIPLSVYMENFAGIGIKNPNTNRDVIIHSARIVDPTVTGEYRPKNPVDTGRDAVIVYNGIEITRESNTIDDIIPGVTLNIQDVTEKPVKLTVEPDREAVKNAIIDFVGTYNRLMADINITMRNDEAVLQEIEYLTEDEKKTYKERLGILQGDITLSQLRSSMQTIMMNAYPSQDAVMLLSMLGISTNASIGSGYDAAKLRGYLEIDEKKLDNALQTNFEGIRALFGFDTDNDFVIDSGVAVALDNLIKPFVETGGIFTTKLKTFDTLIADQKKIIDTLTAQLAKKEEELKRKYGLMEGVLGQLEQTSGAWDNFGNQNGN